ncbi:MAG TPA: TetR/AcrR family transcriptional regulator [Myxococcota bacterium]|nr:TetR/AcrR family transcriptional regulator [Myxococcota bacterium]
MLSKREQNRIDQRCRILDAARSLFASRGLDQVTMAEVAQLAGVARATVFNYFASKHALLEAIAEDVFARDCRLLEGALADPSTPTSTLVRALFDQMGSGLEQSYGCCRGVFREIAKIQIGLDEGGTAQHMRETALTRLERLLARGQERGEIRREFRTRDLTCAFESLANGTILHWLYENTSGSLRERMQRAAEIFLRSVAANPEATRGDPLPDLTAEGESPTKTRGSSCKASQEEGSPQIGNLAMPQIS